MKQPKWSEPTGTGEWAEVTVNFVDGCEHNCKYCYAKSMARRFKRECGNDWSQQTINLKKVKYPKNKRVMTFSAHDITPSTLNQSISILKRLLERDNQLLIVSKPHLECIKRICSELSEYKKQIVFRFTIGSYHNDILSFWEPNAPLFEERFDSLKYAYTQGFETSVSMEPMLDTLQHTENLVRILLPYITDTIWLGLPKLLIRRLKSNGENSPTVLQAAENLLNQYSKSLIYEFFKRMAHIDVVRFKDSIKAIVRGFENRFSFKTDNFLEDECDSINELNKNKSPK